MHTFGYDNQCMLLDGKPWFPIMGEIHYSRLTRDKWRESLGKMKAGGVNVASAYAFWIHHEEREGEYDFSGDRDLRRFMEDCRDSGLYMLLRIGPWCHGEARNGGFPDWLLKKDFVPRTNDERYFAAVDRYYRELFRHADGMLLKDGGPIIGVQIENEYGHCGGLTGSDGEEHMRRLTALAKNAGFEVPLYTATGWGGAVTGGLLPVMGGYCEAPWDQRVTEIEPSSNYVFTHERNDHNVGSDFGLGHGLTFDPALFPYLTAELGGGLQVTRHRRPVACARDIGAMTLTKLGSGVNLLGYYMYHGGVNPDGKLTTLQESRETGYPNDVPIKSYDFRAPLGSFGQITDTFRELKLFSLFAADFGGQLCRMPAYIPDENPVMPGDMTGLRHSFRHNGEWGFVFVNNYVRRRTLPAHPNTRLTVSGLNRALPPLDIASGDYGFFPFDMPVTSGKITFATASPLCRVGDTTVLYGGSDAYVETVGAPEYLLISREDALNAYKIGDDHLVIFDGMLCDDGGGLCALATGDAATLKCFPALNAPPRGFTHCGDDGPFALYRRELPPCNAVCRWEKTGDGHYTLSICGVTEDELLMDIHYAGESACLSLKDKLLLDDFYSDGHWQIGLRRYGFPRELTLDIEPLYKDAHIFIENRPEGDIACELISASLVRIARVPVEL